MARGKGKDKEKKTKVRIEKIETSGVFSLDGEDHEVENNVYVIGDNDEVIVVDAAHHAEAILEQVGDREILAVICTHGHNDHVNVALELAERDEAPVAMHRGDRRLWEMTHEDQRPDISIEPGGTFEVADIVLTVLHTPGHSPGSICLYAEDLGVVFTGDTLFKGGPGATGRSFSDFPTILTSISDELLSLPAKTRVLPGHGEETTIGTEEKDYADWVERGH
ncbi:MAG: MBL fold metallo-hydrolase [Streptosporangiales bacterium]|nr:MBL fold metallo-hydrolase [Streptosporangiales bacterium]